MKCIIMTDLTLALMTGVDLPVPACQICLHQPTIQEISFLGETNFFEGLSCLCIDKTILLQLNKNQVTEQDLEKINNFTLFQEYIKDEAEKKNKVRDLLMLLLPQYKIMFTPRAISLLQGENSFVIDENNFEDFQAVLKQMFCVESTDEKTYNPQGEKAKEIAAKLMRGRQRVAALKKAEEEHGSRFAQYLSVITVGVASMSLQNAISLTLFQLYDLIQRLGMYVNWNVDLQSRLAGAKADKPLDNWMKKIH